MVNTSFLTDPLIIIGTLLFFVAQMALCFKVKNIFLKLIPVIISAVPMVVLFVAGIFLDPWGRFFCMLLAIYPFIWLIVCGVCWGIWGITRTTKKKAQ